MSPIKQGNPMRPCFVSYTPATYFALIQMFVGLLREQIHFICLAKEPHTANLSLSNPISTAVPTDTEILSKEHEEDSVAQILIFIREYYSNEQNIPSVS